MIEEEAIVCSVEAEHVVVKSIVKSSCSGCQQVDSCGSGQISKAFPQKTVTYEVQSQLPVQVGDRVLIGLAEDVLLSAAWQVYAWPLLGLIIFGFIGQWAIEQGMINHELLAVMLSALGGYFGYLFARKRQRKLANCPKWSPSLIKILPKTIPVTQITP